MIVLHCTRKAQRFLGFEHPFDDRREGSSRLGDWYVNLIPVYGGEVLLFTNVRSLASVIVPAHEPKPLQLFVGRVANLLSMLGVEDAVIERELDHYAHFEVAKTSNRRVLSSMNQIAFSVQSAIEAGPHPVSLSDLELELTNVPMSALGSKDRWGFPRDVALALMKMEEGRPI